MGIKVGDKFKVNNKYNDELFNVGDIITIVDHKLNDYDVRASGSTLKPDNYWYIPKKYLTPLKDEPKLRVGDAIEKTPPTTEGGALRYNEGKPQFSHLSPDFILEMMKSMTAANEKYGYLNYAKKMDVRTASDSLMRHFLKFQQGDNIDEELGTHHLALVAVNAMIMYQNLMDFGDEVDNRYSKAKDEVQNV